MPMVMRLEQDEGEVPLLEVKDGEAIMALVEAVAEQLGNQHRLQNPELIRYARQYADRDGPVFMAVFDRDELELIEAVMADIRQRERELEQQEEGGGE